EVVPLGLELDRFLAVEGPTGEFRARLGLDHATPLVGIVGRLVPIKDVATAIAAVERLEGVHLAVVGDGEMRPALEAEGQRIGVYGRAAVRDRFSAQRLVADMRILYAELRLRGRR